MTKDQIANELKQEFAKGNLKPSQLKRSKSANDIPVAPPLPALQKSKSSEDILPEPSEIKQRITALQDELTIERKRVSSLREDLATTQTKLKIKEQAITNLKKQNSQLEEQYFTARLKNLQDFSEYYDEKKALKGELEDNISQGIKEITKLEKQLLTLKQKKLETQEKLNQTQLKNTQLELKALSEETYPISFNWAIVLSLSVLVLLSWKGEPND